MSANGQRTTNAGFSGMGFKVSCRELVMSELILDGVAKTVDIGAFRPQWFNEGNPIKAEYEYVDDWLGKEQA